MSSTYVRTLVRDWLQDGSMVTPYYDTVNADQNPLDDIWVTADFDSLYRERLTFCEASWQEEGDITLVYTGQPGIGDGPLISQAETDVKSLLSFRDPLDKLTLKNISGPNEFSGGSTNQGYQIEFVVDYTYSEG